MSLYFPYTICGVVSTAYSTVNNLYFIFIYLRTQISKSLTNMHIISKMQSPPVWVLMIQISGVFFTLTRVRKIGGILFFFNLTEKHEQKQCCMLLSLRPNSPHHFFTTSSWIKKWFCLLILFHLKQKHISPVRVKVLQKRKND